MTSSAAATGSVAHLADALLSCAPPAPALISKSIVSGNVYSCGLTLACRAYCGGSYVNGQLGTGNLSAQNAPRDTPALVSGGLTFTALAAGALHTYGISSVGTE